MKSATLFALVGSAFASRYNYYTDSLDKSYATQYKRVNVEYVVDELNFRNEMDVRAIRDSTEAAITSSKVAARDEVDGRVDAFEEEIAGLKQAWADALAAKRAALAEVNAQIIDTQHMLNDSVMVDVEALNQRQDTLIQRVLDADIYHDHTTVVFWLEDDDRLSALTWETYPTTPSHPFEAYMHWKDTNQPAHRYHDYVNDSHLTAYPTDSYEYDYDHYDYGYDDGSYKEAIDSMYY